VSAQWAKAWRLANKYVNCPCDDGGGRFRGPDPFWPWASKWEFYNTTDSGHAIMASLALDGAPISELP